MNQITSSDSLKNKLDFSSVWSRILFCSIVFGLNFTFKLIEISTPSFWYDEIISVQDTQLEFGHIKHEAEWDKNPPFYHYVLWIWSKLFGISEFTLRSMSAFFSSLAAVLIFVFVIRIGGLVSALGAVAVFSVHPFLFYYAQEARSYSLQVFLILANLLLTYSQFRKPGIVKAFSIGILNFLLIYTHYITGLFVLCQFLFFLIVQRREIIQFITIYLVPIFLVLLRFTRKQYEVIFFSHDMSMEKKNVFLANPKILSISLDELFVADSLVVLYLIVGGYYFWKYRNSLINSEFNLFLFLTPVLSITLLYLVGRITNVYDARYLIFIIPIWIVSLFSLSKNPWLVLILVAVILVASVPKIHPGQSKKMDYKYAAFFAKRIKEQRDPIILLQTHDIVTLFLYYYDRDLFLSKDNRSREHLSNYNIYYIENSEDLNSLQLPENREVLFFQTYHDEEDSKLIMDYFRKNSYSIIKTESIEGISTSYLFK